MTEGEANYNDMKRILNDVQAAYQAFEMNAVLFLEKGNKAAGRRSRTLSIDLAPLLKSWRKATV